VASIHSRARSPYLRAAFTGPDGRPIARSTMQSDRAKAQAVALEFERAAKLAKRDELTEARAREILTGILERVEVGNSVHGLSIQEHYRGILDDIMARADFGERLRTVSIEKYFSDWLDSKTSMTMAR